MNKFTTSNSDHVPSYQLYLRAGLPHQVLVSPKARTTLQLPVDAQDPEWLDLMWVVRGVITGLMPAVELRTNLGNAKLVEFYSITAESLEPVERRIAVVELEEQTVLVTLPEELARAGARPLVLVAEDDADLRQLVTCILQSDGIEVIESVNGISAWEAMQDRMPMLVLTDVDMPQMNGLDLCRRIKSDPRMKHIPVLIWSGNPANEASARQVGAEAFISKPVNPHDLVAIIKRHLNSESAKK